MIRGLRKMDIAFKLGTYVYGLKWDDVPEDVQKKCRTCFMNSIGVGVSGYELGPATHARNIAKLYDASENGKTATLMMDGTKLTMPGAVFANTVLFHSRAQEDTMGSTHNGTMIVPAVLAIAENSECSGKELMEAVLAGYEVTGALERKLSKLTNPRGFRASAIFVIFGVAAACAKLMKLNAEQIADAIRIAASLAGGIQESFAAGTTEWFYQNGCAARNGLIAAMLAADGVNGAGSAFDGGKGFMNVFAGSNDEALVNEEIEALGKDYSIRQVIFKFNPCCAIAQTPFIVSKELAEENNVKGEDIESIEYHMNPFESNYPGTKYKGPFTTDTQTTMSCAFNISNAIVNRKCTKKGQQIFDDRRILDLVDKVTVVDDEQYPIICGKIIFQMKDGRVLEKEMVITPEYYNLTWDENEEMMYRIHGEVGIPQEKTKAMLDIVKNLETTNDIKALIEAVRRP